MNENAYVPLKWLAARLGVETGTIRHWRYRGWIDREGKRRHVRVKDRQYCAKDVFDAEADTYVKSQSNRERKPVTV